MFKKCDGFYTEKKHWEASKFHLSRPGEAHIQSRHHTLSTQRDKSITLSFVARIRCCFAILKTNVGKEVNKRQTNFMLFSLPETAPSNKHVRVLPFQLQESLHTAAQPLVIPFWNGTYIFLS